MALRLALVRDLLEREEDSAHSGVRSRAWTPASLADEVNRLALGMLWHPADARRAAGEILRSAPRMVPGDPVTRHAVLKAAVRYLLEREPSQFERQQWTFELLAEDLERGRDEPIPETAFGRHSLALVEEVKLGCSQSMLLCLERPLRIAYLLSTLDAMDARLAASILELEIDEFRALASLAEAQVHRFTDAHCGLVNPSRPCRCSRRLGRALVTGRVDPDELLFAERNAEAS